MCIDMDSTIWCMHAVHYTMGTIRVVCTYSHHLYMVYIMVYIMMSTTNLMVSGSDDHQSDGVHDDDAHQSDGVKIR